MKLKIPAKKDTHSLTCFNIHTNSMKKYNNISSFLIPFTLSIFSSIILLPNSSSGAHYQYESCGPTNCGKGPNISFPFYVPGRQESYCGYPGFALQCSDEGFPLLRLPGNDYAVEQFFYRDRSFRVYDAAVLTSGSSSCLPSIRNMTLPSARFDYVNVTGLYLFSGCEKPLSEDLSRYDVGCGSGGGWDLAMDGGDGNLGYAVGICERNVVVPVEGGGYGEGRNGILNILKVLRKGFVLRWKASDCSECEDSGGRCGFDVGNYHFRCFCPDRPHSRSCKPEKWKALVENKTGVKLKRLRSDNGGEYELIQFIEYCKLNGIRMEKTMRGTPQLNGVAERMNRTLSECARCIQLKCGLPQMFWDGAVNTSAFLINRGPTNPLDNGGGDEFGYRFWDEHNQKIIRSRDVVFNEQVLYKDRLRAPEVENAGTRVNSPEVVDLDISNSGGSKAVQNDQEVVEPEPSIQIVLVWRSERQRHAPDMYSPSLHCLLLTDKGERECYAEAGQTEDVSKWKLAMDDEMDSLMTKESIA
ncbi:hypothetical protein OROMI_025329 [Orobanche minor]